MRTALVLSFLLVGCGPQIAFDYGKECGRIYGASSWVDNHAEDHCRIAADRAVEARNLLVNGLPDYYMPAAMTAEQFDRAFQNVNIRVHHQTWGFMGTDELVFGEYVPSTMEVHVILDEGSLLHELLHHYDMVGLGSSQEDTANHKDWLERGWLDLDGMEMGWHPPTNSPFPNSYDDGKVPPGTPDGTKLRSGQEPQEARRVAVE